MRLMKNRSLYKAQAADDISPCLFKVCKKKKQVTWDV